VLAIFYIVITFLSGHTPAWSDAVEAEAELFQVGLQVLGLNTAALGAPNKPTLAQDITPVHRAEQLAGPRLGRRHPMRLSTSL